MHCNNRSTHLTMSLLGQNHSAAVATQTLHVKYISHKVQYYTYRGFTNTSYYNVHVAYCFYEILYYVGR